MATITLFTILVASYAILALNLARQEWRDRYLDARDDIQILNDQIDHLEHKLWETTR